MSTIPFTAITGGARKLKAAIESASATDRIAALRAEIVQLSTDQAEVFCDAMARLGALAEDVKGNPAQPPGVREIARQVSEDLEARAATLTAIMSRTKP